MEKQKWTGHTRQTIILVRLIKTKIYCTSLSGLGFVHWGAQGPGRIRPGRGSEHSSTVKWEWTTFSNKIHYQGIISDLSVRLDVVGLSPVDDEAKQGPIESWTCLSYRLSRCFSRQVRHLSALHSFSLTWLWVHRSPRLIIFPCSPGVLSRPAQCRLRISASPLCWPQRPSQHFISP